MTPSNDPDVFAIINSLPLVVFRYTMFPDGRDQFSYVSDGAYSIFGMSPAEAMADSARVWALALPEDIPRIKAGIAHSVATLATFMLEWRVRMPDGTLRWHRGIGHPTLHPDGYVVADAMIIDFTEEKEARDRLAANESRLNSILMNLQGAAVHCCALDGTIALWNKKAEALYEYPASEAVGRNIAELILTGEQDFSTGNCCSSEAPRRTKSGREIYVDCNNTLIQNPDGTELVVCLDVDVTAQRQAEQDLERAHWDLQERVKELRCLYQVAHMGTLAQSDSELLTEAVNLIPLAFTNPEVTTACITLDGIAYTTRGFSITETTIRIARTPKGNRTLTLNVSIESTLQDELVLPEEMLLLESLADNLVVSIEALALQKELTKTIEYLKVIISSTPECIKVLSADEQVLDMNPAGLRMLEIEHIDQFRGQQIAQVIHPDDLHMYRQAHQDALAGKRTHVQFRVIGSRGRISRVESVAVPLTDTHGEVNAVLSLSRDITDLYESMLRLEESEMRYRKLFHASPIAKFVCDPTTYHIVDANQAACNLTGLRRDALLTKALTELLNEGDKVSLYSMQNRLQAQKLAHVRAGILSLYRPIGGTLQIDVSAHAAEFEDRSAIVIVCIDVTEKVAAERTLQDQAKRMKAIAEISSDFIDYSDWHDTMERSFRKIGEAIDVDRVYCFNIHADDRSGELCASLILEWSNQGIQPQIDNQQLQDMSASAFPALAAPLMKGQAIKMVLSQVDDPVVKHLMISTDVKSFLLFPIHVHSSFWGVMGVDDCREERMWTAEEEYLITAFTTTVSAAIEASESKIALEKSLKETTTVLESIGDVFFVIDPARRITYWNLAAERATSVNRSHAIGEEITTVIIDFANNAILDRFARALAAQSADNLVEYLPGMNKWLDISMYPFGDGLAVYLKDVSERVEKEEALREANERFKRIADVTYDAIFDWEVLQDIAYWGTGYQNHFALVEHNRQHFRQELLGSIHPEDVERVTIGLDSALESTSADDWEDEFRFLRSDGSYGFVTCRASVIRDTKGKAMRLVGALTDETERMALEQSLRDLNTQLEQRAAALDASNKDLEHFASAASHDLQEPLRLITGFLGQIDRNYGSRLDEKGRLYIEYAVDGADRMQQIIHDLLEYSRVGRINSTQLEVDVEEVVAETLDLFDKEIKEQGIIIKVGSLPSITCHRNSLRQVFQNLIGNAVKYVRKDVTCSVSIECHQKEHEWEFVVRDNGIGIEKDFHEKVFVIFQRLHSSSEYRGTGIGLALVKKIVEGMGGRVWIESELNAGTSVFFTIPRLPE